MSEDGPMNEYLKDNNIEMAAQRATSVLSVVNHAPIRKIKLKDKIKVRLAVLSYSRILYIKRFILIVIVIVCQV